MRKYKPAELNESQLENLVHYGSEVIEDGLKYVDHQKINGKNHLDVLFVDSEKTMVVGKLTMVEDDNMLLQGLDYYNYVTNNIEVLTRIFKNDCIDPTKPIKLILVAPNFSQTLTNCCSWIDANISLYTYKCIKFEGSDEVIPIFSKIFIPTPPRRLEEMDSFEDQLGYLTNQKLREILASLLADLPNWGNDLIVIEPIKYAISIKGEGKIFMTLTLRRENFLVETHSAEGKWTSYPVTSREDLDNLMMLMKSNMENKLK